MRIFMKCPNSKISATLGLHKRHNTKYGGQNSKVVAKISVPDMHVLYNTPPTLNVGWTREREGCHSPGHIT